VQLSSTEEDLAAMQHPAQAPRPHQPIRPREGERDDLLARLREEIRRIEHRPGRRDGVVASGLSQVDGVLPGGGFRRGAIAELCGGPASGKTAVALSVFAALSPEELFAWVDAKGELYPPAAAARGVDLGRLLVVRPPLSPSGAAPAAVGPPWRAALWAAEALLASGAFGAVAIDVALPRAVPGADAAARRLQVAAERGGAVGLWLSPSTLPAGLRLPAALRLEVSTLGGRLVARPAGGGERARGGGRAA
jgi:protein ImuA